MKTRLIAFIASLFLLSNIADSQNFVTTTPAVCFDTPSGTAVVDTLLLPGLGLIGPYSCQWSNGSYTLNSVESLYAGNYTVTVYGLGGATLEESFIIDQPAAIYADIDTIVLPTCSYTNDGSIIPIVSGGISPYSYNWSNGAADSAIYNLYPDYYGFTVTDANNCEYYTEFNVLKYEISVYFETYDNNCFGECNGQIISHVYNGVEPYSFHWDASTNFSTQDTLNNLCGGNYKVTVTDANGCIALENIGVWTPSKINIDVVNKQDVSCNGEENGYIETSVTGGSWSFSFNWSNGGYDSYIYGLGAGSYTLTVTDTYNGCKEIKTFEISEPEPFKATFDVTNATCYGSNDGGIITTPDGGVAPYSFYWSNGAETQDLNNLTAETYYVDAYDDNGCYFYNEVTVQQPEELVVAVNSYDVSTCGGNDGAAKVTVLSGGIEPVSYLWTTGETLDSISNKSVGVYEITITNADGCQKTEYAKINEVGSPVSGTGTEVYNVLCNGQDNGSIYVVPEGVGTSFTYEWSTSATTQQIDNLGAGNYTVTITNDLNCKSVALFEITEPDPLVLNIQKWDITCYGSNNGYIEYYATGGTPQYTYSAPGGGGQGTKEYAYPLAPGEYPVSVIDMNGCEVYDTITMIEPAPISVDLIVENPTCLDYCSGKINLVADNGIPPYEYYWSNGYNSEDINWLCPGSYSVDIYDYNGCYAYGSAIVEEPMYPQIQLESILDPTCTTPGIIDITVYSGNGNLTYNWDNGTYTSEDFTSMIGGYHQISVTDSLGCNAWNDFYMNYAPEFSSGVEITNTSACGAADGAAFVYENGGFSPFTYLWSNTETTNPIQNLTPGIYSVTVTDSLGCVSYTEANVNDGSFYAYILENQYVSCSGYSNGALSVYVEGGVSPYTYLWSNFMTTDSINNLSAGLYSVTITDNNGCIAVANYSLEDPMPFMVEIIEDINGGGPYKEFYSSGIPCPGEKGMLNAQANNSVEFYQWSNGMAGIYLNSINVLAGTYSVTVTNYDGCTATDTHILVEPAPLQLISTVNDVMCKGFNNGSMLLEATGGTPPYNYSIYNGAMLSTDSIYTDLAPQNYYVLFEDYNFCMSEKVVLTINEPDYLSNNIVTNKKACFGVCDGKATSIPAGGTSPYSFNWGDGITTQTDSILCVGQHQVTVTDANLCPSVITNFNMEELPQLVVNLTKTNLTCSESCSGKIVSSIMVGTPPFQFNWSNGQSDPVITGLCAGAYTLTMVDGNNCSISKSDTISAPLPIVSSIVSQTDVTCFGGTNGTAEIASVNATSPVNYTWSNGMAGAIQSNLTANNYMVFITDAINCKDTLNITINQPQEIVLTISSTPVDCYGNISGTATVAVTGGVSPYNYIWNDGQITSLASNLAAGNYSVTVTDNNNCSTTASLNVTQPLQLTTSILTTNVICNGLSNGSANLSVSGGITPYVFTWSNGSSTEDISSLTAGNYSVTITDVNGCVTMNSTTVNEPTAIVINPVSVNNVTCNGNANGSITISATGGSNFFSYLWSNGFGGTSVYNLAPGSYTVTVTDSYGCSDTLSETITEPTALLVSIDQVNDVSCYGLADGSALITSTGGTGSYTYLWTGGQNTSTLSNVSAGSYSVTVTDNNNCHNESAVLINQPEQLILSVSGPDSTLCVGQQAILSANVTGGTTPYTYNWYEPVLSSLQALAIQPDTTTTYYVSITDAHNCYSNSIAFTVNVHPQLSFVVSSSDEMICLGQGTQLMTSATGGSGNYSYVWSDIGFTTNTVHSVIPSETTSYYVTISDNCSQDIIGSITVFVNNSSTITGKVKYSNGYVPQGMATVKLYSVSQYEAAANALIQTSAIDANNYFKFENVPNDEYIIKVLPSFSIDNVFPTYFDSALTWQQAIHIDVTCDSVYEEITLVEIVPEFTGTGTISGTITYETTGTTKSTMGEPIPGVEITLEQEPDDEPIAVTTTGQNGGYEFSDVNQGFYSLLVDIPGLPQFETYNFVIDNGEQISNLNFIVDTTGENNPSGIYIDESSGINSTGIDGMSINVYPNPFVSGIHYSINDNSAKQIELQLINNLGQRIYLNNINKTDGSFSGEINLDSYNLTSGNYFLIIKAEYKIYIKKLVKE